MIKFANFKSKQFFLKGESPKLTRSLGHMIACLDESYVSCIVTMTQFANFKSKVFFFKESPLNLPEPSVTRLPAWMGAMSYILPP
jgi:hypothetical protein